MSVQVVKVGEEETPIVVIDNFVQSPDALIDDAVAMVPFPSVRENYYPGLRRQITPADTNSFDYVQAVCRGIVPVIHSTYGVESFEILDASYSLVTTPPQHLQPLQSIPHFDFQDDESYAILHYLSKNPGGGTGFYRHIRSGFETLSPERIEAYKIAVDQDAVVHGTPTGYFEGNSNGFFELARIEARFNRALIYPGKLLHSGLIPENFGFSSDPRQGRLTANIFIRARKV